MDIQTKAHIVEGASKLIGHAIRTIALRPRKVVVREEVITEVQPAAQALPVLALPPVTLPEIREATEVVPSESDILGLYEEPVSFEPALGALEVPTEEAVTTACLSCSRSHLSTVSGALGESLRFARGDPSGIRHPEVQRRIMLAEDEILMLERIDLSADSLIKSPPGERAIALEYLPRIRNLRQNIGDISSVEQLGEVAAEASILGQEFRLAILQGKGMDLSPIISLARAVEEGSMTMQEAKERVKELLPEGEEI